MTSATGAGETRLPWRIIAFILLIDLVLAFNMVAIKESVVAVAPLLAVALRYMILAIVCAPYLRLVEGRMKLVLATGMLTGAIQFGIAAYSYEVATNLSALAIAAQLGVPVALILAVLIDKEKIAWRRTLGILLAFAGVTLVVFDPAIADERLGVFLTFGSAICWAAGTLLFRRLAGVHILTIVGWQSLITVPTLFLAQLLVDPGALAIMGDVPLKAFGWIVYSAIIASLIGNAGMSWLLQRYPVSLVTPYTLATPLMAVTIASLTYGTPITPVMIGGGILTLAGVAIITLRTANRRRGAAR